MNLFVKVCHGSFHDILPKEYSGTFHELLWEDDLLLIEMPSNNSGQSDIVTHKTNT